MPFKGGARHDPDLAERRRFFPSRPFPLYKARSRLDADGAVEVLRCGRTLRFLQKEHAAGRHSIYPSRSCDDRSPFRAPIGDSQCKPDAIPRFAPSI